MQVFIKKLAASIDVPEWDDTPEATRKYIVEYGWTQALADAASAVKMKDLDEDALAKARGEARGLIEKKLDGLRKGIVRQGGGGKTADPVKARARVIATKKVQASPTFKAWVAEKGLKLIDKAFQDELRAQVEAHYPKFMELAASQIAAEADIELEL